MQPFARFVYSRTGNIVSGVLLGVVWALFAYRHLSAYLTTQELIFVIFFVSETLQALFFVFRSTPKTVSLSLFDWMVALGGTFAALLFRPGGVVIWPGAPALVFVGMLLQIMGLLSLNRSFGIVAAKRTIKTSGMFFFVRHPMYASYLVLYLGYILFNASAENIVIAFFVSTLLYLRIESEEAHLSKDPEYRAYKERVSYRLIPFVY